MLKRVSEALLEEAMIESSPRMEGRQMVMILAPQKAGSGGQKKKTEG